MSRYIALAAGIVAISLSLFVILRKRNQGIRVLIVPAVWFFFAVSKNLSEWISPANTVSLETFADYTAGSPLDRYFLLCLIVLGLMALVSKGVDWNRLCRTNLWLLVFLFYSLLSIGWSAYPAVSFKRWTKLLGDLLMVLLLVREKDPCRSLKLNLKVIAVILLPLSVIFIKYFREIGVSYTLDGLLEMWVGVTTHKNSLGELASYSLLILLLSIREERSKVEMLLDIVFMLIAVYLLRGSSTSLSATSVLVLFLGIYTVSVCTLLRKRAEHIPALLTVSGVLFLLVYWVASKATPAGSVLALVASPMGRDATLTGRVDLWNRLIEIAAQRKVFGVGYGSFWIGNVSHDLWQMFSWRPTQGHNGYLDIYVELGYVGVALLVLMIVEAFKNTFHTIKSAFNYGVLRLTLLIMVLVQNITESSFAKPTALPWLLFLFSAVMTPTRERTETCPVQGQAISTQQVQPRRVYHDVQQTPE